MPVFFYKGRKMSTTSQNSDLQGYGDEVRMELGRRISRVKKLRVLDVGTGFGINVAFLADWLGRGSRVWTIDPSKGALEEAKEKLGREAARRVEFVVASVDDLKFGSDFFDVVASVMVLHHLDELRPALREMARVLKLGGKLIITDFQPGASHELKFHTRHKESDFFKPEAVVEAMRRVGMAGKVKDLGMWYLVEAKKARPKLLPAAERRGTAR